MDNVTNTAEMESVLGEHIKRIRLLRNIKREDLAEQAGISMTALKNLETGQGASIKTFLKVLRALDKLDWILTLAPTATINPLNMLQVQERRSHWGASPAQRQRARTTDKSKK